MATVPALLLFLFLLSPPPSNAVAEEGQWRRKDGGLVAGGELWCVAKNNADDATLQAALDWACGPGSADCSPVQKGGVCFEPDEVQYHASFAFNDYFVRHGSSKAACDFSGAAALTGLNPSHGDCTFPSSSSVSNGSFSGSSTSANFNGGARLSLGIAVALFSGIAVICKAL
ncbi:hypothetical protein HPP92_023692 [Vanilla planifolia]|uniref:X8 domain-containing protein n=1 Tax=Vanilla planifolia TaxID=51239 RepID=A0A835UAM6_VANPL|nr:hypothetical protein HPP92_023692 [Vanilla planifolia]